jgi:hypothetical protein
MVNLIALLGIPESGGTSLCFCHCIYCSLRTHVKMNDIAGENLCWIVHNGFEAIVEVRVEAFYQLAMDLALICPSPPWRERPTHESSTNKETHSGISDAVTGRPPACAKDKA